MREIVNHAINPGIHYRIHYKKVARKQEHRRNHDARGSPDLFPRRPRDAPHLGLDVLYVCLDLLGPANGLTHFHKIYRDFGLLVVPPF